MNPQLICTVMKTDRLQGRPTIEENNNTIIIFRGIHISLHAWIELQSREK